MRQKERYIKKEKGRNSTRWGHRESFPETFRGKKVILPNVVVTYDKQQNFMVNKKIAFT